MTRTARSHIRSYRLAGIAAVLAVAGCTSSGPAPGTVQPRGRRTRWPRPPHRPSSGAGTHPSTPPAEADLVHDQLRRRRPFHGPGGDAARPRPAHRVRAGAARAGRRRPDHGQPRDRDHERARHPQNKAFTFQAPPVALTALRDAGVDVATMANNHGADYGSGGLADTLQAIKQLRLPGDRDRRGRQAGLRAVHDDHQRHEGGDHRRRPGAGRDDAARCSAPARTSRASRTRSRRSWSQAVHRAKAAGYVVIVYLHWGIELQTCPSVAPDESRRDAGPGRRDGGHRHARARAAGRRLAPGRHLRRVRPGQLPVVGVVRQQPGRQRRAHPDLPARPGRRRPVRAVAPRRPRRAGARDRRRTDAGSSPNGARTAAAPTCPPTRRNEEESR